MMGGLRLAFEEGLGSLAVLLRQLVASDGVYIALLFALFVLPRLLMRLRIPSAITAFALGLVAGPWGGLLRHDATLHLLATFGITALFLFAGLEVDLRALRRGARLLLQHLAVRATLLAVAALAVVRWGGLDGRPAVLVALALVIPSTGFILDSVGRWGLDEASVFWVKGKAIATELLALLVLFVTQQSTSAPRLAAATLVMAAMIAGLPPLFRWFAERVAPWAPRSEFSFLVMMAVVMASVTRQLGAYYLVGAFLVGIAARRFRAELPAVASEEMLHAVERFASFFAPFYFFAAGTALDAADLAWPGLLGGAALALVVVPIRVGTVVLHRRIALGEPMAAALRIALPMQPTFVFTLVLAGLLRERYDAPPLVVGSLVTYAVLTTLLPGLVFRAPVPTFDAPVLDVPAVRG